MATAARLDLLPLPPFDPVSDPTSISQRWQHWKRRFETYLLAVNITDDAQKRALLLYQAGAATQEIFDSLPVEQDEATDYKTALAKLDTYFAPQKNVDFEIFQFRQAKQRIGETTDQFATRLRKLATNCEFTDLDKEIKSAIIQNCSSKQLRRLALREEKLTLAVLLSKARILEASDTQAKDIEESLMQVETAQLVRKPQLKTCFNCGFSWPHRTSPCPAKTQSCRKCGRVGHFAKVCKSRAKQPRAVNDPLTQDHKKGGHKFANQKGKIHHVHGKAPQHTQEPTPESSSDEGYLFTCDDQREIKMPQVRVKINNTPVKMILDTGASIDILDESTFHQVKAAKNIHLSRSTTKLFAYGSEQQLPVLGKFHATIETKDRIAPVCLHVVRGNSGSLLSYTTAADLNLIQIKLNAVKTGQSTPATTENLEATYPKLFDGIGKLKDREIKLHIDSTVPPVAQPARRIPFHLRKKVSETLRDLEDQGIIEKVAETSTPWISPLVVIPKNDGTVRLCVDMRMPNRAIQRERHPSPTIDDLIHALNGATVFSKLDLRSGYHQLVLSEESRHITTFATHKGLRRYTRLNFGTSSASEIFQNAVYEQIRNIEGAVNISDDVIIYGNTQNDHDRALHAVCKRFQDMGLTLNKAKCELNKKEITFFGYVFSDKGISADPQKVHAIHNAPPPQSVKDIRSFLGMANYCAKFISQFSDISEPLRNLTKKNSVFRWTPKEQKSFDNIKLALTSDKVMAYFDQTKQTELFTDASPTGLSAILSQITPGQEDRKVVAYVSRSLSDSMDYKEIQDATFADQTLQALIRLIHDNSWNNIRSMQSPDVDKEELNLFAKIRSELTVNDDASLILRGSRIVLPKFLRHRAIAIAHEGHQGIVKTKQLLREKIWFPNIDKSVKDVLANCLPCQAIGPENRPAPLHMNELPPKPWHTVHIDHCGPFPTGEYILVVIDAYSRFPEVDIVHSTSASATIAKLDRIFATHGLPHVVKSDNGPPFNSADIKDYMKENGIHFQPITPLWPQANSEAENFNKPMTKAIKAAQVEGRNWKKELYRFVLNYRATPHTTTKYPPAQLLFNRKIRIKLPDTVEKSLSPLDEEIRKNDTQAKVTMKQNADRKRGAKERKMSIGNLVLIRQRKRNKLTSKFAPKPFRIVRIKGTMITACRNGHYVTRNISFFKPIQERKDLEFYNDADDEESLELPATGEGQQEEADTQNNARYPQRIRRRVQRYGQNIYDT
eukprot:gene15552-6817_t